MEHSFARGSLKGGDPRKTWLRLGASHIEGDWLLAGVSLGPGLC